LSSSLWSHGSFELVDGLKISKKFSNYLEERDEEITQLHRSINRHGSMIEIHGADLGHAAIKTDASKSVQCTFSRLD
jgi:hypothetical protein